ncbi:MAG: hypothetical protein ABI613_00325 [Gemmatimonadota bacterium]
MTGWDPAALELVRLLARTARGPRREGIYALWLTVRVTQDLLLESPPGERAHRRRVAALEHRFATLTLPPQLRRALAAAVLQLKNPRPEVAVEVLAQLTAPARDGAGQEAGEVLAAAARSAREKMKAMKSISAERSAKAAER